MRLRFLPFLLLCLTPVSVWSQDVLFQSSFDSDDGFIVLSETEDVRSTFGYDYSEFDDIPEAPNSGETSGSSNTGLKLEANLFDGVAAAVAVVANEVELTDRYEAQVDAWLNYNFPAGTAGTTEFGGLAVGHDGEFGGLNGASFIYDTDGDSSRDYILYKNLERQELDTEQYAVPSLNNTDDVFVEAFPSVDLEVAVPNQFLNGVTSDGAGGFRWMTITATVDTMAVGTAGDSSEPGIATFSIADAETGNSVEIGTIDNSNGETAVDLSGNVAVLFADLFSSVSNAEDLSFGVFDNLIIRSLAGAPSDPLDCNGDGSVTTDDVACATAETLAGTLEAAGTLAGDLNLDGEVAFPDFLILSTNFGNADLAGVYANGDIDLDGTIGFPDFLVLSANFGQTAGAAASVPEPTGLYSALAGICVLGMARRRRG